MEYLTVEFSGDTLDFASVRRLANSILQTRKRKAYLDNHKYKLYQGGDGRWFTRFPNKDGGSVQKVFRTKEDAENAIVGFYEELENVPTIEDVFFKVLNLKFEEGSISESTVTRNTYDFIRFYSDFADVKINNVGAEDVEDFLRSEKALHKLDTKGYSHLLSITRLIFKYAKRKGLVDFRINDVISDMDWGRNAFRKEKDDTDEVFSDEEVMALVNYFRENQNGKNLGLLLCFLTGLRIGELAALKWEDITEDEIIVRRTESSWSDEDHHLHCIVKNLPKTQAGKRRVPIPLQGDWIIDALRRLNPDGEYVFMLGGSRTRTIYFRKAMEKACDAVGIKRRSPHKIRKTYASILLDNNIGEKMVIENMGHTNIETTNNSYARRRKNSKQRLEVVSAIPEFDMMTK